MKITSAQIRKINIPFKVAFTHSLASRSEVESVILQLNSECGESGFGESIPRDYVTGETVGGVITKLHQVVLPNLVGREFNSFDDIRHWLLKFETTFASLGERDLCVKTCVDLALIDLVGKIRRESVLSMLGSNFSNTIKYSAVLSADSPEKVAKTLKKYRLFMLRQVKLKVGTDHQVDLENVRLARKILKGAEIRIDANAEWDLEESKRRLMEFAELGVVSVEQPMPVKNRDDYPLLVNFLNDKMHVSIDESLCSQADALWFAENKGCTIFNIRISKNGGIINSLKLCQIARESGIRCQLGAQVGETSLLSAAGRVVSSLDGNFIFNEGSFGTHLLQYDLTSKPLMFSFMGRGSLKTIKKNHGLGVRVDTNTLDNLTVEKITL